MPHLDLATYLSDDSLVLDNVPSESFPEGKSYTVASPSAKFTLVLKRMMQIWGSKDRDTGPSAQDITDMTALVTGEPDEPDVFQAKLLGAARDEMVTDGISGERLAMITQLVMVHYGSGSHVAEAIVSAAGEAQARPNRAARRSTAKKKAGRKSARASTGTATRTRTPASTGSSTSPAEPAAVATA